MTNPNRIPESTEKIALLNQISQELSQSPLAEITVRDLLGNMLSSLAQAERGLYLQHHSQDKANGYYDRQLAMGSMPLEISVPRVRSGEFRPATLPPKHQRGYAEENQAILLSLLASSRSVSTAKAALTRLGLPVSEADLDTVVSELQQDFKLRNTRPLSSDLLALWIDGKYIEVRDGDSLKPSTIYLAIGLTYEGHKRVIACLPEEGRESLDGWKKLLRNLLDRGLRRILILVQDDFSGLSTITESLFPKAHIQLCTVHMLRNAKTHLSKSDAKLFTEQFRSIKAAWSQEQACADFDKFCTAWKDKYPSFIEPLLRKKTKYLAFLHFPDKLRRSLSTTNTIEVINRQFEKIRLNNSGYFQSQDDLHLKLNLSIQNLENGCWKNLSGSASECLDQLRSLFFRTFEMQDAQHA